MKVGSEGLSVWLPRQLGAWRAQSAGLASHRGSELDVLPVGQISQSVRLFAFQLRSRLSMSPVL
jgi:hypothetical protein